MRAVLILCCILLVGVSVWIGTRFVPSRDFGKSLHIKDGTYVEYYANGATQLQRSFTNDKLSGLVLEYYPEGQVRSSSFWVTGEMVSWRVFDKNGNFVTNLGSTTAVQHIPIE